jgi:hypothetical protein
MRNDLLVDVIGWVGVAALLLAYILVSMRRLDGGSAVYQGLNVTGSALLIINSFYYGAFPSVGINIAWIVIGILALSRIRFGRTC